MSVLPVWYETGSAAAATGAVSPDYPGTWLPGDNLLLVVETADTDPGAITGWTQLTPSSATGATRVTCYHRRAQVGDDTTPTVPDSGDHQFAVILGFRGGEEDSTPWDVISTGSEGSDTSVSANGGTTTVDNCLIVVAVARDFDIGSAEFSAWANADLSNFTERQDQGTAAGNGGGLGIAVGGKAVAGTFGASTATLVNASSKAFITLALRPAAYPWFNLANVTAFASNTAGQNYNWPTPHEAGDIGLLILESANDAITVPSGWAHVSNSPQSTGATGTGLRLTVLWKRATSSSEAAATIVDPGDHQMGNIFLIKNASSTGDPWDVSSGGVKAAADTASSIPGVTTTVPETVVLYITTRDNDATGQFFSAWTNSTIDLGGVAEVLDGGTASGNGGGIAFAMGRKVTAGATGTTTATIGVSTTEAFMCIAFKAGGPSTTTLTPDPVTVPISLTTPVLSRTKTVTPSAVAVPLALTIPTVTRTKTLASSSVAVPLALTSPSLSFGAKTLTPSAVAIPLTLTSPTVALGSITLTPSPVTVPLVLTTPAVGNFRTLVPSPVAIPLTLTSPTLRLSLAPSPVTVPVVLTTPTISLGAKTLTPSPVAVVVLVTTPNVGSFQTLTTSPVAISVSPTTPTIVLGAKTVAPSPVPVPLTLGSPVVLRPLTVTPSPVSVTLAMTTPSVTHDYRLTTSPVTVPVVIQDPFLTFLKTLTPTPVVVQLLITVPFSGIVGGPFPRHVTATVGVRPKHGATVSVRERGAAVSVRSGSEGTVTVGSKDTGTVSTHSKPRAEVNS